MISFIISAIKIIVLLGFLVFIHEFGHFIVAKLCKVKVNEFALGFGPVLLTKQGKETKYQLRLIPLGGFVSMEGETERSNSKSAFNNVSIPKRIAIVAAGGLVNIIFAICVFLPLQMSTGKNITTKVNNVVSGYTAESVGIQQGDIIKKINGKNVRISSDVNEILSESHGEELTLTIERNGNLIDQKAIPTGEEYYTTGMYLEGEDSTKILGFVKDGSVESQGFKTGDTIISVAGENVENNSNRLSEVLEANYGEQTINIIVRRLGNEVSIDTNPIKKVRYKLGIEFAEADNDFSTKLYYGLVNTGDFAFSIVENLSALFSGKVSTADFMGPVGISRAVSRTDSFVSFISLMTLISLSLGVTNLLPFPPLDGGKIVLLIIEAIRKKPLDEKYEVGIQMIGFGLMIMLSLYVTYHDILRII